MTMTINETATTAGRTKSSKTKTESKTERRAPSIGIVAVPLRLATVLGYYAIFTATATVLIPSLGMWLHQQSGLPVGKVSTEGLIAFWVMPYAFAVVLILIADLLLFRAMWRGGTSLIEKVRDKRDREALAPAVPLHPGLRSKTQTTSKNTKRSK